MLGVEFIFFISLVSLAMPNRSTKVTDQVSFKIIYIVTIVIKKKSLLIKTHKKNHYLNEVFFVL